MGVLHVLHPHPELLATPSAFGVRGVNAIELHLVNSIVMARPNAFALPHCGTASFSARCYFFFFYHGRGNAPRSVWQGLETPPPPTLTPEPPLPRRSTTPSARPSRWRSALVFRSIRSVLKNIQFQCVIPHAQFKILLIWTFYSVLFVLTKRDCVSAMKMKHNMHNANIKNGSGS